ncbi:hypothetical protein [Streptomyces sp. NPDC006997]|uniref:hypothetical protein n=1 Tax=Streptomyces sp. NPDC006997 TaxID=3155356 RepID=UPI0033F2EC85
MQSNSLFISTMRTFVPVGVGLALSLTGRLGIPVDSEDAALVVLALLVSAYYLVFRGLEWLAERLAWRPLQVAAGMLLGWARPPAYGSRPGEELSPQDLAALRRRAYGGGEEPR